MIGNKKHTEKKTTHKKSEYYGERKQIQTVSSHTGNYPRLYLGDFKRVINGGKSIPIEIINQMILTYSNENDKILDMTCHNKYVGSIAINHNRNYIGVDINEIVD